METTFFGNIGKKVVSFFTNPVVMTLGILGFKEEIERTEYEGETQSIPQRGAHGLISAATAGGWTFVRNLKERKPAEIKADEKKKKDEEKLRSPQGKDAGQGEKKAA